LAKVRATIFPTIPLSSRERARVRAFEGLGYGEGLDQSEGR